MSCKICRADPAPCTACLPDHPVRTTPGEAAYFEYENHPGRNWDAIAQAAIEASDRQVLTCVRLQAENERLRARVAELEFELNPRRGTEEHG